MMRPGSAMRNICPWPSPSPDGSRLGKQKGGDLMSQHKAFRIYLLIFGLLALIVAAYWI